MDKLAAPRSLADRLRAEALGIEGTQLADLAAALQCDWEAEEEHAAKETEQLHGKDLE